MGRCDLVAMSCPRDRGDGESERARPSQTGVPSSRATSRWRVLTEELIACNPCRIEGYGCRACRGAPCRNRRAGAPGLVRASSTGGRRLLEIIAGFGTVARLGGGLEVRDRRAAHE